MKAVHFGAGNIGRGFVGLILHNAGYEVVFADVNAELIDALAAASSYDVHEVGLSPRTWTVDNFRALNSASDEEGVVAEIASADIVTTAVGPNILRFVAPLIGRALLARPAGLAPLQVMACENAINATDALRGHIETALGDDFTAASHRAVFANTAVDRIVPGQAPDAGLNVTVEDFFEWAIESGPFGEALPSIPEAHFVPELAPYIERKLFTVNTGHAATAYFGAAEGIAPVAEAIAVPEIFAKVKAVLEETKTLLVAKHEFEPAVQEAYLEKNLQRFANPYLPDTVDRVGRAPMRKLSRHERFVGPAAELAERGTRPTALLVAIRAALVFDVPADPESVQLQEILGTRSADEAVVEVTGIEPGHPLFDDLVQVFGSVQSEAQSAR
ncbi:mannitol-1-phosphate 5-dehydrogenase [Subtercola boreus]|uniref:Mannitol-1-phosphate 5-dehydrogenase n=1 Tax=Subtercola boreus TaxID=120213 RepID=A0A3E0W8F6_9MICO|nr:mannitol-1-phosphate 5-dehydrogenase [Subtercola boreus]RFA19426.1 mannitol-1-phosphate 5-dehydrogenase [Subtercola boreus]RFA19687.1 mannitol-1-phosphate 5-dehydrogenase [Subtercola boreus]RFA26052.1 mannitol-1-phosphate 5-dehydrogenase [Subtercola boreus]